MEAQFEYWYRSLCWWADGGPLRISISTASLVGSWWPTYNIGMGPLSILVSTASLVGSWWSTYNIGMDPFTGGLMVAH